MSFSLNFTGKLAVVYACIVDTHGAEPEMYFYLAKMLKKKYNHRKKHSPMARNDG
jgi:hypothetical protein